MALPDFTDTAQAADASLYKTNIDETAAMHNQTAGAFYAHEAATPDMTVVIDGGYIQSETSNNKVVETILTVTAPTTNPRIDKVLISDATGTVTLLTGAEADPPTLPDTPKGSIELALIATDPTTIAITNANITNRRPFNYNQTPTLKTKVISIGDWDMVANLSVSVAHGLTHTTIRSITVTIRNDDDSLYSDLAAAWTGGQSVTQGITADSTNINLNKAIDSAFYNTGYDAVAYNRGWITIQYVP